MSSSTSLLDLIAQSQSSKEVTANALFDAGSPAVLFGRRASLCSGLNWFYYGGTMLVDGVLTVISNNAAALVLSASATNYIEASRAGVVSKNTTAFTPGSIPLYTAVTGASTVTSYTDQRAWVQPAGVAGKLARVMASDANITLTQAEANNDILQITSSVSLTTTRNVVVPLAAQQWTVYNGTTGAQSLQFIGASGTGVTVANGKRAIIYSDGTNVVRVTADV
jgi:hypothetical protein